MTAFPRFARPLRAALTPLAAVVLALALAGCGGEDPQSTPTSPSAPTSSDPPPDSATPTGPGSRTAEPTSRPTPPPDPPSTPASPDPAPTGDPTTAPSDPDDDGVPETYGEAVARVDARGGKPRRLDRFQTPQGIYCALRSDIVVGCELAQGGIPAPELCGNGPSQRVGRIEVTARGPEPVCNTDTIREMGVAKVGPVTVAAGGRLECLIEGQGITCVDRQARHGFFLAPKRYEVFS